MNSHYSWVNSDFFYSYQFYHNYSINFSQSEQFNDLSKWYQNSFQILVNKMRLNDIIDEEYYLQHSSIQLSICTRLARMGDTSIHSFIFIQILVIDLDWTYLNELGRSTVCRFGISIHDSIIQYQTRKSYWTRVLETILIRSDGW